jgi:hypothetical protein
LTVGDPTNAVTFDVTCGKCRSDQFQILGYPKIVPNPSPYFSLSPGEVFFRPPHRLRCVACRAESPLFDARTQGYDAVLNAACSYESGGDESTDQESAAPDQFRVSVIVFYNVELSELSELADKAKVKASDLFDWIMIKGSRVADDQIFELSYECA